MLIASVVAVSGCSGDKSAASRNEKWLDVPEAVTKSGSPDTGCESMVNELHESLIISPDENSPEYLMTVSPCRDAGLKFGKAIRCKFGRLQVKCL